jgi:V8-like Glu-specific endopeptidase
MVSRFFIWLSFVLSFAFMAQAAWAIDSRLEALNTGEAAKGFEAVGRLNRGDDLLCTASLIRPNLVLTAAHCLVEDSGALVKPQELEFLAGFRHTSALAYRKISRFVVHPKYIAARGSLEAIKYDVALIELHQPVDTRQITPFAVKEQLARGEDVRVVSYAADRTAAPSLQDRCTVIEERDMILIMTCDVNFGSSGAPIFGTMDGAPTVVSVVSAKAVYNNRNVSLGPNLKVSLRELYGSFNITGPAARIKGGMVARSAKAPSVIGASDGSAFGGGSSGAFGNSSGGAKFIGARGSN